LPQLIVHPAELGDPTKSKSIALLPPAARTFEHVPDFSICLPGDLILFRDPEPGIIGKPIQGSQEGAGFPAEDAAWTHVAVYLDEDFVVEAVAKGVVTRSLYSDIPSRILRVRRRNQLCDVDRYRIALRALRMLNTRYTKTEAVKLGWRMRRGLWNGVGFRSFGRVVICSKVFYDAYTEITRTLLDGCPIDEPVTPAHLSATKSLDDVFIPWLKLA
jgi:hypothetical protein